MSERLILRRGGAEVSLLPHLGGAIGGFSVDGRNVLRPTPGDATDPLETACFPLVPYANRIAGGRFTFAGTSHELPSSHPVFPYPIHGLGWVKPWMMAEEGEASVVLTCSHAADEHWPWDWSAMQRFELADDGLRISLELVNTSEQAMPAGLGVHPYFVRNPEDVLQFGAAGLWQGDEGMIPVRPLAADALGDFASGAVPSSQSLTDNCYFGWTGTARWGDGIILEARGSSFLHVFAPPGEDFICLEPTSQMPDALNRPDFADAGGTVLRPGGKQMLELEISVRG